MASKKPSSRIVIDTSRGLNFYHKPQSSNSGGLYILSCKLQQECLDVFDEVMTKVGDNAISHDEDDEVF